MRPGGRVARHLKPGLGRLLWHSLLPTIAYRPAAPLGAGAVIQVVDPQRVCVDVGISRSVDRAACIPSVS
jgi:hypothetical protein